MDNNPIEQQQQQQQQQKFTSSDVAQNRHKLSKMLQLHGYSACLEALVLLEDHFSNSNKYESIEDFIIKLNHTITFQTKVGNSIIDPELAHLAIQKLCNDKQQADSSPDQQQQSDTNNEQLLLKNELKIKVKNVQCLTDRQVPKDGEQQANEFNIHYNFLFKRLSALPIFQGDFKLSTISSLIAFHDESKRCICFGLLVKDASKIDGYMLIDSTGRVTTRITPDTTFRNRLAYANCMVIVEGVYVTGRLNDVLYAANIGLPPMLLDPVQDKTNVCADEKLVIILRELYLDDEDVCKDLDMLFTGYNSMDDPPILFILIGDFTREPCNISQFRVHSKKLLRMIRACDNLKNSHFVIIPGPKDSMTMSPSTNSSTMPKQALTKELFPISMLNLSDFNNVHLATNPVHIYLDDRQISVIAHSYFKELKKHLLHDLSDHNEEFFETAKQIILSNAHLSAGISKTYHSSMNLWHKPDLLILADTEAFGNAYEYSSSKLDDTSFSTIPSFSRQSNQFKVYYIKSGEVEDSQVSSDAYHDIEDDEDQVQVIEQEPESEA